MKNYEPVRFLAFIALILLVLLFLQLPAKAQNSLKKRVTISLKQESLKTALDKITVASGVKFTYNGQIANSGIKVSINAVNESLSDILLKICDGQPLSFSELDQEIYIRVEGERAKKSTAGPAANPAMEIKKYTVSGTVSSFKTGETLIAATIRVSGSKVAAISNEYGFYSITLPKGKQTLEISAIGFASTAKTVELVKNTPVDIALNEASNELQTVVISSSAKRNVKTTQMGMERLSITETKTIPTLLGERDVIKTLQLLPGVKSSGEGSGGFLVRGGSTDQNMILLDEAPLYNASHLLGFFSTINSDAIKNVTLYKSGMPAQYGGGLSSVLDIKMNDGDNKKFGVSGGIGLIAARINVEGPIQKEKSSFLISTRRTYLDQFLKLSNDSSIRNNKLYFYDVNLKANYILGNKDRLYISGYFGRDVLGSEKIANLKWGNTTSTIRWNHLFSSKLFSNTSLIYSNYDYKVGIKNEGNAMSLYSQIRDINFKEDLQWYANDKNTLNFGVNAIYHTIKPGEINSDGNSGIISQNLQNRYSVENAAYISNTWKTSDLLTFTYGLHLSAFTILGKGEYFTIDYDGTVTGSRNYGRGEIVKTYLNLEPRVAASLQLNESTSLKASYVRNAQNLHLISNSATTMPTDRWAASTNIIKPEVSDQVSIGYYKNLSDNVYEFTAETYYKLLKNQIDYRNGAQIFTNKPIETQLLFGKGRAYGLELLLKKKTGRLTGWVAYSLSKSERKVDGINNNDWYNIRQDRTHDISIVGMFEVSKKWSLSANWVYSTGNAITYPNAKYKLLDENYYYFTDRNQNRMPAYHRLDVGATRSLKRTKKFSSDLTLSLYNVYGRENAYTITFEDKKDDPSQTTALKTTLFRFVPSVSYDFRF